MPEIPRNKSNILISLDLNSDLNIQLVIKMVAVDRVMTEKLLRIQFMLINVN